MTSSYDIDGLINAKITSVSYDCDFQITLYAEGQHFVINAEHSRKEGVPVLNIARHDHAVERRLRVVRPTAKIIAFTARDVPDSNK